ncbi:hypothetical protein BDV93DRAFT_522558 [Ceratobasidium sp. AG-I]|nr:hypothetical protein BDV93DRAFT_522558 [Ceratobasidium sp. AG-I]
MVCSVLPKIELVLDEAKALVENIATWTIGKSFNGVQTSNHKHTSPGPSWFARTSLHSPTDGTFDEFWSCLGPNHSLNEKEYVPEVKSATLLGSYPGFEAWTLGYKFTPPISNRTFTVLIACILENSPTRQGFVISLPLDVSSDESLKSKEPSGIRGRYVSVERVREADGQVEWIMATRSSPGGLIPSFLSEGSMPSKISEDVPHALAWMKSKKGTTS